MAKVFLPYELRRFAGGKGELDVAGATLGEVVKNLEEAYPGISDHLLQDGRLKPGLAGGCRIRCHASGLATATRTGY